ncbi:MAG: alanine:cation symporter family protein, partial [Lentisphaeria bacterium]|nr:alanine:cation symporter family protein [Lentisphaeria bacterium]
AFSTIISWNYFGKINFEYLFGRKAVMVYSILAVLSIFCGTLMKNDLVWELQDMFNQLMVLPNILALLALSQLVIKAAKKQK